MVLSVVKSTCFCTEPGFDSQHSHEGSKPPLIQLPEDQMPSIYTLRAPSTYKMHIHIFRQNIHTHTVK